LEAYSSDARNYIPNDKKGYIDTGLVPRQWRLPIISSAVLGELVNARQPTKSFSSMAPSYE